VPVVTHANGGESQVEILPTKTVAFDIKVQLQFQKTKRKVLVGGKWAKMAIVPEEPIFGEIVAPSGEGKRPRSCCGDTGERMRGQCTSSSRPEKREVFFEKRRRDTEEKEPYKGEATETPGERGEGEGAR